jgi:twinfilin
MLYASTRNNLTKALGSAPFTDSIFATSKADITGDAYSRHLASQAAPKPMTPREKEIEEIKLAEGRSAAYDGSRVRRSHVAGAVGFQWSPEAEQAVKELGDSQQGKLVTLVSTDLLLRRSRDSA